MSRTIADASRDYRARKTARIARHQAALEQIAAGAANPRKIAKDALEGAGMKGEG